MKVKNKKELEKLFKKEDTLKESVIENSECLKKLNEHIVTYADTYIEIEK